MFPVWCSVATTQAILERFDPGLEIGEMKSQTKYSVHRLMMMQTGQKPPQHWRRAFHSRSSSILIAFWESLNSGSQQCCVSGGLTGPATGVLRLALISPCGLGKAASYSAPLSSAHHPWANWAPSGADQLQQTPKSFPPHNLCLPSPSMSSLPCCYLNTEDPSRCLH